MSALGWIRGAALVGPALAGVLGACGAPTGVLVTVEAEPGLAPIDGLGAVVSNCAALPCTGADVQPATVDEDGGKALAFPATFVLDLRTPVAGPVEVCVEARAGGAVLAGACGTGTIRLGRVSTVVVVLDAPMCGNGVREGGEVCDGADLGDADCVTEKFDSGTLECEGCSFDTSSCAICGDGTVGGEEACDLTDLAGNDCTTIGGGFGGGTLACTPGCTFDGALCTTSGCGDGTIDAGEECEPGPPPLLGGDDCGTLGFSGGALGCDGTCQFDTSACCGDGVRGGAEECDLADLGGQDCASLGFDVGVLNCTIDCTYDTAGCMVNCGGDGVCDGLSERENCTNCPADCTCGALSCDAVYSCWAGCSFGDFACLDACYESGCAMAQEQAYPLWDCALAACLSSCTGGFADPPCFTCVMSMCPSESAGCGSTC